LLWPLYVWSAWAQPATVLGGGGEGQVRALFWTLFASSAWAQAATVVAGTAIEGADLDSGSLVGVGSARHFVGGHDS
jgi:hypothetical protein